MPGEYMGVGSQYDQLNREGKTTCQVPVGPKQFFITRKARNTATSATERRKQSCWSKWNQSERSPGLNRKIGKSIWNIRVVASNEPTATQFIAAWCDGSVQSYRSPLRGPVASPSDSCRWRGSGIAVRPTPHVLAPPVRQFPVSIVVLAQRARLVRSKVRSPWHTSAHLIFCFPAINQLIDHRGIYRCKT